MVVQGSYDAAAMIDAQSEATVLTVISVESIEIIPDPKAGFPGYASALLIICGIVMFGAMMIIVRNKQQKADDAKKTEMSTSVVNRLEDVKL